MLNRMSWMDCVRGGAWRRRVASVASRKSVLRARGFGIGVLMAMGVVSSGCGSSEADPGEVSFFVSSTGSDGRGGDLGGVAASDQKCNDLAAAAGFTGHTWAAYLSTDGADAKDRIGGGPWVNFAGDTVAESVGALHSDGIAPAFIIDENGAAPGETEHDVITGSKVDGTFDADGGNCLDYSSSNSEDMTVVGHTDDNAAIWNNAHPTPCSPEGMAGNNGVGRIYCFGF